MQAPTQYDAFISYSHQDRDLTLRLTTGLKEKSPGVRIWWDENIPQTAADWPGEIATAILGCKVLFAICSENTVDSEWVRREIQFAVDKDKPVVGIILPQHAEKPDYGIELLLSRHQKIMAAEGITPETLDDCAAAISEAGQRYESKTKTFDQFPIPLPALELSAKEIPPFDVPDRPVVRACRDAFCQSILEKDWDSASKLYGDLLELFPFQSRGEIVQRWIASTRWYVELRQQAGESSVALPDLIQSFETLRKNNPDLQIGSDGSPVRQCLRTAWIGTLDTICEQVLNCLLFGPKEGSFNYVLQYLEPLKEENVRKLLHLIELETSPRDAYPDVFAAAESLLPVFDTHSRPSFAALQQCWAAKFPPTIAELQQVEEALQRRAEIRAASEEFFGFLDINRKLADGTEHIERLREQLTSALHRQCGGEISDEVAANVHQLQQQILAWRQGLEQLFEVPNDSTPAIRTLDSVTCFPNANSQARLVEDYSEKSRRYADNVASATPSNWTDDHVRFVNDAAGASRAIADHIFSAWRSDLEQDDPNYPRVELAFEAWNARRQLLQQEENLLRAAIVWQSQGPLGQASNYLDHAAEVGPAPVETWRNLQLALEELELYAHEHQLPIAQPLEDWSSQCFDQAIVISRAKLNTLVTQLTNCQTIAGRIELHNRPCLPGVAMALATKKRRVETLLRVQDSVEQIRENIAWAQFDEASKLIAQHSDLPNNLAKPWQAALELLAGSSKHRWIEDREAERWPEAIDKLRWTLAELRRVMEQLGDHDAFADAFELAKDRIEQELKDCEQAVVDEEKLLEALSLMQQGSVAAANGILDELESQAPSVTAWRRVVKLVDELRELAEDPEQACEPPTINAETGIPPESKSIEAAERQMRELLTKSKEATAAVEQAQENPRIECQCAYPAEIEANTSAGLKQLGEIQAYVELVAKIREEVFSHDNPTERWSRALMLLEDFLGGHVSPQHPAFKLLSALNQGRELERVKHSESTEDRKLRQIRHLDLNHPFLREQLEYRQQLEHSVHGPVRTQFTRMIDAVDSFFDPALNKQFLITPAFENPDHVATFREHIQGLRSEVDRDAPPKRVQEMKRYASAVRKAVGPNEISLQARIGEIDNVFQMVREACGETLPHHLVTAVMSPLRDQDAESIEAQLESAVGACALVAGCPRYRQLLRERFAPNEFAMPEEGEYGAQKWIASELRAQFEQLKIPWGDLRDTRSWAFRWAVECEAVRACERANSTGALRWPMGPMLVRFYGLEDKIIELAADNYDLRRWYGPCDTGTLLERHRLVEQALEELISLEEINEQTAASAIAYEGGLASVRQLRNDVVQCRLRILLKLLLQAHLELAKVPPHESGQAPAQMEKLFAEALDLLELADDQADLTRQLVETVNRVYQGLENQLENPKVHFGRSATTQDGEIRKQCMDRMIDRLEEYLKRNRTEASDAVDAKTISALNVELGYMKRRRAGLIIDFANLKFRLLFAKTSGVGGDAQALQLADEMVELAQQCQKDAPQLVDPHWLLAQCLVLRAVLRSRGKTVERAVLEDLEAMIRLGAKDHWSPKAMKLFQELLHIASNMDQTSTWLRSLRAKGIAGIGNEK